MPSATGESWEKYQKNYADEEEPEKKTAPLSDEYAALLLMMVAMKMEWLNEQSSDIQVLKTYGAAPYATALKKLEKQINETEGNVNEKIGVKVFSPPPV